MTSAGRPNIMMSSLAMIGRHLRWYKLCTMLMIYNSRAAFFCSLVVSIAVGILRATKILPDGLWIQLSVLCCFPSCSLLLATDSDHVCQTTGGLSGQTTHCTAWWRAEAEGNLRTKQVSWIIPASSQSSGRSDISAAYGPQALLQNVFFGFFVFSWFFSTYYIL